MAALEYFAFLNLASRQLTPKLWLTRNVMLQERKQGATLCPWSLQGWPGSLPHPKAPTLSWIGMGAPSPGLKSHEIPKGLAREPQGQDALKTCMERERLWASAGLWTKVLSFLSQCTLTSPQRDRHLCFLLIRGREGNHCGGPAKAALVV